MKIKKKTLRNVIIVLIICLIGLGAFFYFNKAPYYPDQDLPKPVRGNPDSSIEIVEFSDLQCPSCKAAHPIVKQVLTEFGDDVHVVYNHFPLGKACNPSLSRNIHVDACKAAEAVECANDQGKFWEYIDVLFFHQNDLSKNSLKQYAVDMELDSETFNDCLDSGTKKKYVVEDVEQGQRMNVQGTPTFFINGKRIPSFNFESFKTAINAELDQE